MTTLNQFKPYNHLTLHDSQLVTRGSQVCANGVYMSLLISPTLRALAKVNLSLPNTIYAVIGLYFTMVHEIEGLKIMSMMNGYTSQILESKLSVFVNNKFKECSRDNDEEDSVSNKVFGPDQFKVYI